MKKRILYLALSFICYMPLCMSQNFHKVYNDFKLQKINQISPRDEDTYNDVTKDSYSDFFSTSNNEVSLIKYVLDSLPTDNFKVKMVFTYLIEGTNKKYRELALKFLLQNYYSSIFFNHIGWSSIFTNAVLTDFTNTNKLLLEKIIASRNTDKYKEIQMQYRTYQENSSLFLKKKIDLLELTISISKNPDTIALLTKELVQYKYAVKENQKAFDKLLFESMFNSELVASIGWLKLKNCDSFLNEIDSLNKQDSHIDNRYKLAVLLSKAKLGNKNAEMILLNNISIDNFNKDYWNTLERLSFLSTSSSLKKLIELLNTKETYCNYSECQPKDYIPLYFLILYYMNEFVSPLNYSFIDRPGFNNNDLIQNKTFRIENQIKWFNDNFYKLKLKEKERLIF